MFWYVILMPLSPIYLMFGLVFRTEQARLVPALHHQVLILQRQLGKRPLLVPIERLALVLSDLLLGKKKLGKALLVVRPKILVEWHQVRVSGAPETSPRGHGSRNLAPQAKAI